MGAKKKTVLCIDNSSSVPKIANITNPFLGKTFAQSESVIKDPVVDIKNFIVTNRKDNILASPDITLCKKSINKRSSVNSRRNLEKFGPAMSSRISIKDKELPSPPKGSVQTSRMDISGKLLKDSNNSKKEKIGRAHV